MDNIPNDLAEATEILINRLDEKTRRQILNCEHVEDMLMYQFEFKSIIKNSWRIGTDSPLRDWFRSKEIWHTEDMQTLIFESVWNAVHGRIMPLDLKIKNIKKHWEIEGLGFDGEPLN